MDIRTWQDAGRGADPYHPRHRSGRSPFRPWRPGPVVVGSLSTAAVAAVAFAAQGVVHVRTMPVDTRLDGAPNHIGPLTPGPGGQPADAGQSAQLVAPGTATPPPPQPGDTSQTSSGGVTNGSNGADNGGSATGGSYGDNGTSGGSIHSVSAHNAQNDGTSGSSGQQSGHHQSGTSGGTTPNTGHTTTGGTKPGTSTGTNGGGAPTKPGGSTGSPGSTGTTGPTGGTDPGGWWNGGWGNPPGGTPGSTSTPFNAAAAVASAVSTIDAARATHHTAKLRVDPALTLAAAVHTKDMAVNGTFSHLGTDGSDPYTRALRAGCMTFTKEIIARGNPGDDVVKALLQDPGSYLALTSSGSHAIGIAAQQDPHTGQIVWTIELGWA